MNNQDPFIDFAAKGLAAQKDVDEILSCNAARAESVDGNSNGELRSAKQSSPALIELRKRPSNAGRAPQAAGFEDNMMKPIPGAEELFMKLAVQFGKDSADLQKILSLIAKGAPASHGWLVPGCGGAEKLMTVPVRVVWSLPLEQEEISFAA